MRDITKLHPDLQFKISKLKSECERKELKIGISECVRTVQEQDDLYAQGRTKPGTKVTNAKGSSYSSMHQWGVAFDFYRNDGKGAYNDSDGFFTEVGKIGKSVGLEWGGDWKSPVDKPHFQLPDWGSTASKLKSKYKTPEKFMETWKVNKVKEPVVKFIKDGIDYSSVFDPKFYAGKYADLGNAGIKSNEQLFNHFYQYGMQERRQGSKDFNVVAYASYYSDLRSTFGADWKLYYKHYIEYGKAEKRKSI